MSMKTEMDAEMDAEMKTEKEEKKESTNDKNTTTPKKDSHGVILKAILCGNISTLDEQNVRVDRRFISWRKDGKVLDLFHEVTKNIAAKKWAKIPDFTGSYHKHPLRSKNNEEDKQFRDKWNRFKGMMVVGGSLFNDGISRVSKGFDFLEAWECINDWVQVQCRAKKRDRATICSWLQADGRDLFYFWLMAQTDIHDILQLLNYTPANMENPFTFDFDEKEFKTRYDEIEATINNPKNNKSRLFEQAAKPTDGCFVKGRGSTWIQVDDNKKLKAFYDGCKDLKYINIDGTTSASQRKKNLDLFSKFSDDDD